MKRVIAIVGLVLVLSGVFANTCFANESVAQDPNAPVKTSEVERYYDDNGVYRETLSEEALALINKIEKDRDDFDAKAEELTDDAKQVVEAADDTKNSRSFTMWGVGVAAAVLILKSKKNSSKEKKEKLQKKNAEEPAVNDDTANA